MQPIMEEATLGGGCFWCLEAVYQRVKGVKSVTSGYAGGTEETANYDAVCSGTTDHAEVVHIEFNPTVISYSEILDIFWHIHDPTTLNRQGNDRGPQYRSAIFYHDEKQATIARQSMAEVATTIWPDPIVTKLEPLEMFFEAENYHHDYYNKIGDRNPYCTFVVAPKVKKFLNEFGGKHTVELKG